jgi:hypothetical protein
VSLSSLITPAFCLADNITQTNLPAQPDSAEAIATNGCSGTQAESDAWKQAGETIADQERKATNGMAWPANAKSPEIVMTPGMEITARTAQGEIKIRAGREFERSYTWDGETRSAKLWPREQRWYGSLGIYYPGPGEHWKSNRGITRGVLEEGVLWFKTKEDAANWIKRARSTGVDYVFTDDGLLVGFGRVQARKQVNVDVWRIMVDGEKPRALPGSRNDLVSVSK